MKTEHECNLIVYRPTYQIDCDGCGRVSSIGEEWITGIESCCGGGCERRLCPDCVKEAYKLLFEREE